MACMSEDEVNFLARFIELKTENIDTLLKLQEEGHLHVKTGPRAWNMCKLRRPNKSGVDTKRLLWLQSKGRLFSDV